MWLEVLALADVLPVDEVLSETGAEVCEVAVVLIGGTPPSADRDGLGECPMRECGGSIGLEEATTEGGPGVNM